jgi:tetratricopeptide (TPR) repeat protein
MKKAIFLIIMLTSIQLFSQETTYKAETKHYNILSHVSKSNAEMMGAQLESFYDIFNDVFRFSDLEEPLYVEILPNLNTFKSFTRSLTGSAYDSYVYIHHQKRSERELLIFEGSEEDLIFALAYQASIQFIMNQINNPPLWVREGFSVYFSKSSGPELERKFATLKNKENRITLENLVKMDNSETTPVFSDFRTEAWAFVTFLMTTDNKEYTRFLYDTITSLKTPSIEKEEITADIQIGFDAYLAGFLNAQELMDLGIKFYNEKDIDQALQTFDKLIGISPDSWQPLYFLGLLSYDDGNYTEADEWYTKASEKDAPEALIAYVTGLTAWKDERIDEAKGLLSKAARLDEEKYGEKTAPILDYLQRTSPDTAPVSIP